MRELITCGRCHVRSPLLLLLKRRMRSERTLMLLLLIILLVVLILRRVDGVHSVFVRLSHGVGIHDPGSIQSRSQNIFW